MLKKDKNKKLAIFLSGPYRYANHVISNLERVISDELQYDIFVHIWESDLGNKVRNDVSKDRESIIGNSKVKSCQFAKPYSVEEISSRWGNKTGCHSTINAMFGMFTAINCIMSQLRVLPDYDTYTHVFRIRTDCALFINEITPDMLNDNIWVSKNYSIPNEWTSDHIMLAPINKFEKIWGYDKIETFAKNFDSAGRNPEKLLSKTLHKLGFIKDIKELWIRGESYHIVYNPPKPDDPSRIRDILIEKGIDGVFQYSPDSDYLKEISIANHEWYESNKNYYDLGNRFKRAVKKMVGYVWFSKK